MMHYLIDQMSYKSNSASFYCELKVKYLRVPSTSAAGAVTVTTRDLSVIF